MGASMPRLRRLLPIVAVLVCAGVLGLPRPAHADKNDLVLSRLGQNGMGSPVGNFGDPNFVKQASSQFRALASELGIVLAPKTLSPAESLGWNGFNASIDFAFTSISNNASFWKVTESGAPAPFLSTISAFVRKGLPFPVPSFEVGAGLTHLFSSQMFFLGLYAKWTLNEGFHKIPFLPDLTVRGSGGRAIGTRELDLSIAALDVALSKPFGIVGTVSLTPYAGYQILFLILRSGEVDTTPQTDAFRQGRQFAPGSGVCTVGDPMVPNSQDCNNNFTFDAGSFEIRHRAFVGLRLIAAYFSFTAEAAFIPAGSRNAGDYTKNDLSNFQQTYSFSVGVDF